MMWPWWSIEYCEIFLPNVNVCIVPVFNSLSASIVASRYSNNRLTAAWLMPRLSNALFFYGADPMQFVFESLFGMNVMALLTEFWIILGHWTGNTIIFFVLTLIYLFIDQIERTFCQQFGLYSNIWVIVYFNKTLGWFSNTHMAFFKRHELFI